VRLRASESADHLPTTTGSGPAEPALPRSFLKRAWRSRKHGHGARALLPRIDRFSHQRFARPRDRDALLKELASRISAAPRGRLVVAGGDGCRRHADVTTNRRAQLAKRLLEPCARRFWYGNLQFLVTGSVGISVFPRDAPDLSTLVRSATRHVSREEKGRNNYQFFRADLNIS